MNSFPAKSVNLATLVEAKNKYNVANWRNNMLLKLSLKHRP